MFSIKRTVKNINRIREVIRILVKHSFEDVVTRTGLNEFLTPHGRIRINKSDPYILRHTQDERIRLVVEELGPTFIKFAQVLSNRPDVLPAGLIKEFEKLQNQVAPFPYNNAVQIIEEELGRPIGDMFSFFDKRTIGAASIGQVYRARLKSGVDVVVKVQRPKVRDTVVSDLGFMHQIVSLTENFFESLGILNPIEIVEAFEKNMLMELDYREEARNIQQFRHLYLGQKEFHIPQVYREFSTEHVLVTEFVSGCKISNVQQLRSWGLSPEAIAETGMDCYLKQMFIEGFFHADPHPGNILVRPNGQVVLIDFGSVGRLNKRQKYAFAGVIISMAQQDARAMASNLRKLARGHSISSQRALEQDLEGIINDFIVMNVDGMGVSDFTGRFQRIIYKYKIQLPGSVFLILRALAVLEGIGQVLHPNFDTLSFIKPYGVELLKEQYSARNVKNELQYSFSQIVSLLYSAPVDLKSIIRQVRKGELKSNIEIIGLEKVHRTVNHAMNKLVAAILSASFTVGSFVSLLGKYKDMPYFFELPLISLIGFGFAIFWGAVLLNGMRRD